MTIPYVASDINRDGLRPQIYIRDPKIYAKIVDPIEFADIITPIIV